MIEPEDEDVLRNSLLPSPSTKSLAERDRYFVVVPFKTEVFREDFLEVLGCDCFTCVAEGVFLESPVGEGCVKDAAMFVGGTVVVLGMLWEINWEYV